MTDRQSAVPEVLFVCVHNAGRSQMAAALLAHHAGDQVAVRSAGSAPADQINPAVLAAMAELGIDLSHHVPTKLNTDDVAASDVVITMGCGDACPIYPGKRYLDWKLPDPAGLSLEQVRPIRDQIDAKVTALLAELTRTDPSAGVSGERQETVMEVTLLSVQDCPHAPVMWERLGRVLGDRDDVHRAWHVVHDADAATAAGMTGSPTLLIDGNDPFAGDSAPAPSLSCRLYRDRDGTAHEAPSLAQLRAVFDR